MEVCRPGCASQASGYQPPDLHSTCDPRGRHSHFVFWLECKRSPNITSAMICGGAVRHSVQPDLRVCIDNAPTAEFICLPLTISVDYDRPQSIRTELMFWFATRARIFFSTTYSIGFLANASGLHCDFGLFRF